MVFSTIWLLMPFIIPMERIIAKIPKPMEEITTRERRLFLQRLRHPSCISIFILFCPEGAHSNARFHNCRIASMGLSFDARRAGKMEKSMANRNVSPAVTDMLSHVASAGNVTVFIPHTAISRA